MNESDLWQEKLRTHSSEVYIEYLKTHIGASGEEILEVIKRSGISARRIAEYLVRQQSKASLPYSDDE